MGRIYYWYRTMWKIFLFCNYAASLMLPPSSYFTTLVVLRCKLVHPFSMLCYVIDATVTCMSIINGSHTRKKSFRCRFLWFYFAWSLVEYPPHIAWIHYHLVIATAYIQNYWMKIILMEFDTHCILHNIRTDTLILPLSSYFTILVVLRCKLVHTFSMLCFVIDTTVVSVINGSYTQKSHSDAAFYGFILPDHLLHIRLTSHEFIIK